MIKNINWSKVCLFNLLIVTILGVLMRYKIGFEFPYFNQKNLQHAHSNFALSGWISLLLMFLMVHSIAKKTTDTEKENFDKIFTAYLATAYGMLISFAIEGYGLSSICFSIFSIIVSVIFCWRFYQINKHLSSFAGQYWMNAALIFNLLSTLGTFYLSYMMATKTIEQHAYLASVYWYLHFQYNGWFFFACGGLFVNHLQSKNIILKSANTAFWLFALSCIPAYGLSVLWLELNMFVYIVIVIAAIAQFGALVMMSSEFISSKCINKLNLDSIGKFLLLYISLAFVIKISLQLGSTVPSISKFAFGFRPIVIAYLHLVLLAFTSVFLVYYVYVKRLMQFTKLSKLGIILFAIGVALNELVLAVQGIASLSYTIIPYSNEMLFAISVFIFIALVLVNTGFFYKKIKGLKKNTLSVSPQNIKITQSD